LAVWCRGEHKGICAKVEKSMERIGLREAVAAVRVELSESILAAAGEDLRFQVGDLKLDFQVEIARTKAASGGIELWVIDVGMEGSRTSTATHTISVTLKPVTATGEPVLTGAKAVPR
jgi:hypothetical protein